MIDLNDVDGINLDRLVEKYALLDKVIARELAALGYYEAVDAKNGAKKSRLGDLGGKKEKSMEKVGSRLESKMGGDAKQFVRHLEKIVELGESESILGEPKTMVKQAEGYAEKAGFEDGQAKENLVMFTELISFGYRYEMEGGIPDTKEAKASESGKKKRARERAKAVESRGNNGVSGMFKDILGI